MLVCSFVLATVPAIGASAASPTAAAAPAPVAAAAPSPAKGSDEIAPGVYLVPGSFVPGHQPDGNSVIFRAPEGAILFDTGRHPEHTAALLDRVAALGLVPKAVVNSHWHLDHVGGNVIVRQRFPAVQVYASDAIDEALGGFLANYRKQLEAMVASDETSADAKASFRREIGLIDAGRALAPTDVVTASGRRVIAGLPLEVHLEARAVTAGDVWVYDPATRVLVAGDLVTLPAPFLDTACPQRWRASLARLEREDWALLVPGHGAPMSHAEFATYRKAFDGLLDCAASPRPAKECTEGWFRDGGAIVAAADPGNGHDLLDYYVGVVLRGDATKIAKLCGNEQQ
jgi:glyoxylase-like metal-dependent hydrolase (beta-lactamase superfamily II)